MPVPYRFVFVASESPLFPSNRRKHCVNYGLNTVSSVFKTASAMGTDNQTGKCLFQMVCRELKDSFAAFLHSVCTRRPKIPFSFHLTVMVTVPVL